VHADSPARQIDVHHAPLRLDQVRAVGFAVDRKANRGSQGRFVERPRQRTQPWQGERARPGSPDQNEARAAQTSRRREQQREPVTRARGRDDCRPPG
jgi:hypothetical protein